ncbi:hypothetical protein ACWEPB_02840 [Kitasatospora cineracea]
MTRSSAQGGRPAVGPQISVAYSPEQLERIDAAANRVGITRAEWLRRAAEQALYRPTELTFLPLLQHLRELDEELADLRGGVTDPHSEAYERVYCATALSTVTSTLRTLLAEARSALPDWHGPSQEYGRLELEVDRRESEQLAAEQTPEPESRVPLATAWAELKAWQAAAGVLDLMQQMLPTRTGESLRLDALEGETLLED